MLFETYGCGDRFDLSKFNPVRNQGWQKPFGGLWGSPVGSDWSWRKWCECEEFRLEKLGERFEFEVDLSRAVVIDSPCDVDKIPWIRQYEDLPYFWPNYEKMISRGIEAVYLTENGEQTTRMMCEKNLYGWDCECIFVINPGVVTPR